MSDYKPTAQNLTRAWEYYYRIIRDTTDVSGPGFRMNPVGAGELQNLIEQTVTLLNDIVREETPDETN